MQASSSAMSTLYYKKDISTSLERVLLGFYAYQYLLDSSIFGFGTRYFLQSQIVSNNRIISYRLALYGVVGATILAVIRHCYKPDPYGIIIDFIGNVSVPSRSRLLAGDLIIFLLQITLTMVVFQSPKNQSAAQADHSSTNIPTSTSPISATAAPVAAAETVSTERVTSTLDTLASRRPSGRTSRSIISGGTMSSLGFGATSVQASQTSSNSSLPSSSPSPSPSRPSLPIHSRSVEHEGDEHDDTDDDLDGAPSRTRRMTSNNGSSGNRSTGTSNHNNHVVDETDTESEADPLMEDEHYGEILNQETFVMELSFKDAFTYFMSSGEDLNFLFPSTTAGGSSSTSSGTGEGGRSGSSGTVSSPLAGTTMREGTGSLTRNAHDEAVQNLPV